MRRPPEPFEPTAWGGRIEHPRAVRRPIATAEDRLRAKIETLADWYGTAGDYETMHRLRALLDEQ